jgi:tetratricopeptide (TPR) repeat protein
VVLIHSDLLNAPTYAYGESSHYEKSDDLVFKYDKHIEKWLAPDIATWKNERPPLELYAKFLTLNPFTNLLPESLFLDILKTMNYFGNYSNTIFLSEKRLNHSHVADKFQVIKHMCKALKRMGKHEEALEHYRQIMLQSISPMSLTR